MQLQEPRKDDRSRRENRLLGDLSLRKCRYCPDFVERDVPNALPQGVHTSVGLARRSRRNTSIPMTSICTMVFE